MMKPHSFFILFFPVLTLLSNSSSAAIPETQFSEFIHTYQTQYQALSENPDLFSKASSEQLRQINTIRGTSLYSYMHPVVIKGFKFPELQGHALDTLSVQTLVNGKLQPIPFQIDEFDETGLIFIEGVNEHPVDGETGKLNATDELLFMFRDASIEPLKQKPAYVLAEIKVSFPNEAARYVYLVKNQSARSPADYVHPALDEKEGVFESAYIKIRFQRENMSLIEEISFKTGAQQGENIFDSLYFRLSAGLFNKHTRINLDSRQNIKAKALAVKDGPIRVIFLVEAKARVAGIPAVTANFNLSFYEQAAKLKSRFAVDKSKLEFFQFASYLAPLLRRPELYVEFDFVNTQGALFSFESLGKNNQVRIDGKMSEAEHQLNELGLPGNWVWFNSNKDWQMMLSNFLPLAEDGLAQHLLEGNRFYLAYEDVSESAARAQKKRERFDGASPRIKIVGEGLPKVLIALFRAFDTDILNEFDFSRQITVGETNRIIRKIHAQGKLEKIDRIIRKQLLAMKEQGVITNNEELIEALLADMNQIGIAGVSKEQTRFLVTKAMSAIKSFDTYQTVDIGIAFGEAVEELDLDPDKIHYQAKDNTLWWANDVGDPESFYQMLNQDAHIEIIHLNK